MTPTDRRKKIKESEELTAIVNDFDNAKALEVLAMSDGGKLLAQGLIADIVGTIDTFSLRYKEATLQEFVGWGADLNKMLTLYRSLKRAKEASKLLKEELEKALGE